jgi:predicted ATPase
MSEDVENKIKRLKLENFTCFSKVEMDFSPGINVFIGENGTGKTHLLKVLYVGTSPQYPDAKETYLNEVFKVHPLNQMVREGANEAKITVEFSEGKKNILFLVNNENHLGGGNANYSENELNTLYIPPQEMISLFEGFIPAYEKRENRFDITHYHLAKALSSLPLKQNTLNGIEDILIGLEAATGISVIRKEGKFFVGIGDEKVFEGTITASGINKIAQLIYLIMNGSLTKNTILFWDEPEANLSPKYIIIVAQFLQTLANAGCQIFVATHDYLLPYELSLSAEYREVSETPVPDMKFFSFYKGENGTEVEAAETMPDLHHDPIMDGLGLHHNREDILFRKSVNSQA